MATELTTRDRIGRQLKTFLPGFAFAEQANRAGGERDFMASFYGDDKSHLTVALEYSSDDPDTPSLQLWRSGMDETCFTVRELEKIHAVIGALLLAWRSHRGNL